LCFAVTVRYRAVPHSTVRYLIPYGTAWYVAHARAAAYGTALWYGTVRYRYLYKQASHHHAMPTARYDTVRYGSIQQSNVQYVRSSTVVYVHTVCTVYAYPTVRSDVILSLLSQVNQPCFVMVLVRTVDVPMTIPRISLIHNTPLNGRKTPVKIVMMSHLAPFNPCRSSGPLLRYRTVKCVRITCTGEGYSEKIVWSDSLGKDVLRCLLGAEEPKELPRQG